jgi:DNA mismatch repair protein MutS
MVHSHDFYRLYQSAYDKYTDLYGNKVCVFLQKGSFFEIYGQMDPTTNKQLNSGRELFDILGIQMHTYPDDGPGGTTGYYGGIPIYTLDKWGERLTKIGWSVVVIREKKNAAEKVSGREVAEVISPGTHCASADPRKTFFLGSLWLEFPDLYSPPRFGVAVADLTTGQVYLYEGKATGKADVWHTDDLRHMFQVTPPRELLLSVRAPASFTIQDEDVLRRTLYIPTATIHMRKATVEQQGSLEKPTVREEYLRSLFQPRTALPLRTWLRCAEDGTSLQERALTILLRFAEDHAPKLASCLQAPMLWHPMQSLQIINNALTQLNLIGDQGQQCVEDLFASPLTAMGKRSLTQRLCQPIACSKTIHARQAEIEWFSSIKQEKRKDIESCLGLIYDLARLHRSIIRGSLGAADVVQLNQSYQSTKTLWGLLLNSPFHTNPTLGDTLQECITQFNNLFHVQKAKTALEYDNEDETSVLQDSFSPLTKEAEEGVEAVFTQANEWLDTLIKKGGIPSTAATYKPTDKNMFCLHTTKTALTALQNNLKKQNLPEYAKLQYKTLTSAARIEHPILEDFQKSLDSAKGVLKRCKDVEVPKACLAFAETTRNSWQEIEQWVIQVDLALSMRKTADQQGWVKPTIEQTDETTASRLEIEHLRHPLIEVQKRQSKYVTHNVRLGYEDETYGSGWLLYGMNASGKSSLMKAIGLAVLLAQVGSFVPATKMTLRPFKRLATRILNQDNLWAGLSSFAVEMSELREILAVADSQTLVLGDELCAGTESISGTAIVAAGIQHLHKASSRFVLATHLHDLLNLKAIMSLPSLKVWHLHVEYDPIKDVLVYHRLLQPGSGSSMYGLEVAKALHLPHDMIDAAYQFRRELCKETSIETSKTSGWSSSLTRNICSACGTRYEPKLEMHHLSHRADAIQGRTDEGLDVHHIRNLATLCDACHDKEHANEISVGPVLDTSVGPIRQIVEHTSSASTSSDSPKVTPKTRAKKVSPFTEEQKTQIRGIIQANPGLSVKLWAIKIREEGVSIEDKQLSIFLKAKS